MAKCFAGTDLKYGYTWSLTASHELLEMLADPNINLTVLVQTADTAGTLDTYEVCDASPYLKNAARFHGEPTDSRCPVCRRENLTHVHYIYGDELKQSAGQARSRAELPVLAMTFGEFQVYVVEVCRGCGWNHLVEQFLLGRDGLVGATGVASGGGAVRHRRGVAE